MREGEEDDEEAMEAREEGVGEKDEGGEPAVERGSEWRRISGKTSA